MKLFGLKFDSVPLAATALQAARGNTKAEQSPAHIYVNPQVAIALPLQGANPKNQEVDNLATDDLLGEADVYWTYGKWHDAMQIYEWWIGNHGDDASNEVARKYLDCAAKAMDFDAFCRMMEKLIGQNADQAFLQDMAVFGLMRDPSNFDLIGIAEAVEVEESRIISIAQKVVDVEKTPGQRKADLWKRNRNDAGRLAAGEGLAADRLETHPAKVGGGFAADMSLPGGGEEQGFALVVATSGKDYDGTISRHEAGIFGILCCESYLDDSAAVVDHWKIESVMEHLRREMETRPMKLTVYVDYLRIAHGEGMRDEYAEVLLALFSVLLSANAGSGLRRRLLASGRLLGQHWIFDFLSGSQGREFMAVAHKVRDTPLVYVPEKAWAKSKEWMQPLVQEKDWINA